MKISTQVYNSYGTCRQSISARCAPSFVLGVVSGACICVITARAQISSHLIQMPAAGQVYQCIMSLLVALAWDIARWQDHASRTSSYAQLILAPKGHAHAICVAMRQPAAKCRQDGQPELCAGACSAYCAWRTATACCMWGLTMAPSRSMTTSLTLSQTQSSVSWCAALLITVRSRHSRASVKVFVHLQRAGLPYTVLKITYISTHDCCICGGSID
jgi:hypothetical protein